MAVAMLMKTAESLHCSNEIPTIALPLTLILNTKTLIPNATIKS